MGLSLLIASAGWAGLMLADNILDEDRSRQLATRLMDHDGVRNVLVNRLSDGMEIHVPIDEPMSRQELRAVAVEALADPLAVDAVVGGISEAHRQPLTKTVAADEAADDPAEAGKVLSSLDVNKAVRLALIDARPPLEDRIAVNPVVNVQLPVAGLTWFSGLKALTDRFTVLALALGIIGFATSFVVAEEPTLVLRRAAWWTLASAGVWMAVGPLFSAIVRFTVPSSYIVFAAAVETVLVSMRNPAIVMASFSVGLLSMSYLVPAIGRRRGAALLERATSRPSRTATPVPATGTALRNVAVSDSGSDRTGSVGSRMSAAWKEGHGYLDDARVAPFFSPPRSET